MKTDITQTQIKARLNPFILNIYKPVGITSFDVIRKLKKLYPGKKLKIGHFGTLDPFAEGVLLIGIHGATRIMSYFSDSQVKNYLAKGVFGFSSDTLDNTGTVLETNDDKLSRPNNEELQAAISAKFTGKIQQKIPYFSAAKHEGKPLYEWARNGIFIDKDPVERNIYHHEIHAYDYPHLEINVQVSNGTYIRQLFYDIAECFQQNAILTNLIRSKVGEAKVEDSLDFDKINSWSDVVDNGLPMNDILRLSTLELTDQQHSRILHGNSIPNNGDILGPTWGTYQNKIICLGICSEKSFQPKIVWN